MVLFDSLILQYIKKKKNFFGREGFFGVNSASGDATSSPSTAYHQESIGACENSHKDLNKFLQRLAQEKKSNWVLVAILGVFVQHHGTFGDQLHSV